MDSDKRESLENEAVEGLTKSGLFSEQYNPNPKKFISKDFGLCSTCSRFFFVRSEFDTIRAECSWTEDSMAISQHRKVVECSKYEKIGQLTLSQMAAIAIPVDIGNKVGFQVEE